MAADVTNLTETYSRLSKAHILPRLNAITLCNRSYEGDARNSSKVIITTDTRPTGKAGDIGRDGDWPSPVEVGTEKDELDIDQDPASSLRIPWLDAYDVPVSNLVNRGAEWNARRLAEYIDEDVYSVMLGGVAAGNKQTLGDASNFIAANGMRTGTEADGYIADALRDMQTALQVANLMDTGTVEYRWRCDISPAHFRALQDWLLESDQQITRDWKNEIVRTSGLVSGSYRYSIFDFDIYVTNQIPTVAIGGKAHSQMIFSNPRATTIAFGDPLAQLFVPQNNTSDKSGWLMRERMHYGRKVVDNRFIYSRQVRTEA